MAATAEAPVAPAGAPAAASPAPVASAPAAPAPAATAPSVPTPATSHQPAPATAAPDYSGLLAPAGSNFSADAIASHVEWAKKAGISPAHAQAALNMRHEAAQAADAASRAAFEQEAKGWTEILQKDPAFGGKNFETNIRNRDSFLERIAASSPTLQAAVAEFKASPWINHPLFAQIFAAAGAHFADKPIVTGGAAGAVPSFGKQKYPDEPGMWSLEERRAAGRLLPGEV